MLLTGDGEGALEIGFRIRSIQLGRPQCDFTGNAMDLGLTPPFPRCFYRDYGFLNIAPSPFEFVKLSMGK